MIADEELPVIAKFKVRRRAYIGPDGTAVCNLPDFASDQNLVVSMYRGMALARAFDLKAVSLQRTGRLGTYATSLGQEAVAVGLASAMRPEDVLLPSYRDNAALLWRGVTMEDILLFWGGDERGSRWSGPVDDFPFCIPVGSQAPHAAGVAYAFKYRKQARVTVCILGDGATSKGDVWEAMNFAGVCRLPVLFLVNNNQWAISVPLRLAKDRSSGGWQRGGSIKRKFPVSEDELPVFAPTIPCSDCSGNCAEARAAMGCFGYCRRRNRPARMPPIIMYRERIAR